MGRHRTGRVGHDLARRSGWQRRDGLRSAVVDHLEFVGASGRSKHVGVEPVPGGSRLVPGRETGQGASRQCRSLHHAEDSRERIGRRGTRDERVAVCLRRDGRASDRHRHIRLCERTVRPVRIRPEVVGHLGFVHRRTRRGTQWRRRHDCHRRDHHREHDEDRQLNHSPRPARTLRCPNLADARHFPTSRSASARSGRRDWRKFKTSQLPGESTVDQPLTNQNSPSARGRLRAVNRSAECRRCVVGRPQGSNR